MQSLDLLPDAAREFLHQAAQFLPRLAMALAIVLAGWLIAKIIRFAVERGLRAINFHVLTERAGTDHFLQQGGLRGDTTTLFGLFAYWLVILAALMSAFGTLGLTHVTDLLHQMVMFAPKLLIAMLAVVFGSYFARFVGSAVTTYCLEARIPDADLLGKLAQYLIMAFVIMIALSQVEVGGDIVQRTFLVILGGIVLALALAFGLGGKDWAAALLERWWPRRGPKDGR
jgi:Mechanosensitive ion channel, conserved TM helix